MEVLIRKVPLFGTCSRENLITHVNNDGYGVRILQWPMYLEAGST